MGAKSREEIAPLQIRESIVAAQQSKIVAVRDIVENTPPHDIQTLAKTLEAIIDGASPDDATIFVAIQEKKTCYPLAQVRRHI